MLATLVRRPFHKPGWIYEEKYDGYRIISYKQGERISLLSRNGKDRTQVFSAVADAVAKLPARTLLLDGEVVAFDRQGISRFQLLQEGHLTPSYAVFDCLYENGRDLRKKPLSIRRAALKAATIGKTERIFISRRLADNGLQAYNKQNEKATRE